MRNRFDEQLNELNLKIIEMGATCEDLLTLAIKSLNNNDLDLAKKVIEDSVSIDHMEREIENLCMRLLLHQHPVAKDLRLVSAALKIITDMERIGDQTEDIADIVTKMSKYDNNDIKQILLMADESITMLTKSVDAFVKKDIDLAQYVIDLDDIVDNYFTSIKNDIIARIEKGTIDGENALDLLMISKYFERISDHATNIGEWVIYSINGTREEEK